MHDGYGLTEASPVVTTSAVAVKPRPGSVGPPLPGVEVRLVDADGNDVLDGDPGEILVRGPNVFAGYWDDPDATARVLDADGWLHTGDVGVADDDGWLSLVERAKDVVIVSGFNVYPGEVEHVLAQHPTSPTSRSSGEPHPRTGETVVAYVVAEAGTSSRSGRVAAARGPAARALQAPDARRARRRAAAIVRGQAAAARAVVGTVGASAVVGTVPRRARPPT